MTVTDKIENAELLTSVYGRWPSFHDAEIHRISMERSGSDAPSVTMDIHLFQMTDEVDEQGYFVLKNHRLVTLRFCRIQLDEIVDFNHQNVLFRLEINETDPGRFEGGQTFEVIGDTSYGCSFRLACKKVVVEKVMPFEHK